MNRNTSRPGVRSGCFFMLADIALRRLGYQHEVDATLDYLLGFGAQPERRRLIEQVARDYREVTATAEWTVTALLRNSGDGLAKILTRPPTRGCGFCDR